MENCSWMIIEGAKIANETNILRAFFSPFFTQLKELYFIYIGLLYPPYEVRTGDTMV